MFVTKQGRRRMAISGATVGCLSKVVVLCVAGLMALTANAQDRGQARSMVMSKNGIVAAESPLAAQAGVRILESGGRRRGAGGGRADDEWNRRRSVCDRVRRQSKQALRTERERLGPRGIDDRAFAEAGTEGDAGSGNQ